MQETEKDVEYTPQWLPSPKVMHTFMNTVKKETNRIDAQTTTTLKGDVYNCS